MSYIIMYTYYISSRQMLAASFSLMAFEGEVEDFDTSPPEQLDAVHYAIFPAVYHPAYACLYD